METTTDNGAVGRDALAQALHAIMLESRSVLPKEQNGRPRAPSDPRAARIRKEIGIGRANPIGQLLTVLECDVRDQVPFGEIVAPLRQMIEYLEETAAKAAITRNERPLMAVMRLETKAQARTDLAQLRLAESPTCEDALLEVMREAEGQRQASEELIAASGRQLAVVRVRSRSTVGSRRMALA